MCSFMIDLMSYPSMIRNVMVGGHIHHGKTSLLDMLVFETHQLTWDADKQASHLDRITPSRVARRADLRTDPIHRYACPVPFPRDLRQIRPHVTRPAQLKG